MSIGCQYWASLRKKPEQGFELRSNLASTFPAQAKREVRSLHQPTSFLASTLWTTLSRATPCPRELSTTVSVDCAHVTVCVRERTRPRRCPPRPCLRVPPELKSAVAQKHSTCGRHHLTADRVWQPVSVRDRPWQDVTCGVSSSRSGLAGASVCVVCGVRVVSVLVPLRVPVCAGAVLVRCWCSCGGPAGSCAGVGPVGGLLRVGFPVRCSVLAPFF